MPLNFTKGSYLLSIIITIHLFLFSKIASVQTINQALNLTCDNWLRLPSYPSAVQVGDLDIPGNKVTLEAVFMRTAPYSNGFNWAGDLVSKHTDPSDVNYLLRPNNAEITTTNGFFTTPPICEIELNKTYHAAMVYDGNTLKFYRNGFLMSSVSASGNLFQNNLQTRIGLYDALVHNTNLVGYINEVRIWNVARTQAEIRAYMNTSLPNPTTQPGLLAYYTFDNLLNKQGNTAWNGALVGSATINQPNPQCSLIIDSCAAVVTPVVTAAFTTPDTVCVNTPVNITNTSTNASTYYWNFCVADINQPPVGTNIGNPGGLLSQPVFMDYAKYNNNYYGFLINHFPGKLVRLDYGNSLLNTPTAVDLGNFGGIIPPGYGAEGIQIVQNEGKWYAIIVGGYQPSGSTPRVLKVDFGPNLNNTSPIATDWGNIGNLQQPIDLHIFKEGNDWYGLTVNAENNTITRFNFTSSFDNTPTAINLGGYGLLDYPTGIYAVNDNGNWRVFITSSTTNTTNPKLIRLDFGSSLLNTAVATPVNLGAFNIYGFRDITIINHCQNSVAFAVNAITNSVYRFEFPTLTSTPTITNLGNMGNMNIPHSIARLFRVNDDLFTFVTNVNNNTITRMRFTGCTNSNPSSSTAQNPSQIIYNTPGTYNINLTIDDGLPTQSSFCKQIVVKKCDDSTIINDYTAVLSLDPCKNIINVEDASAFNIGDTVLLIQMKGVIIDSTNTAAFGTITDYKNAGNYEFNYVKTRTGNVIELKNTLTRQYDIPVGKVQLIRVPYYTSLSVSNTLTCLPWDGSKGGVLVVNVRDTLELNKDIDVSGAGFTSPGATTNSLHPCNDNLFYYSSAANGGEKGNGLADISASKKFGKGKLSNAGGGGNSDNGGGGGGSNAGKGGNGGKQWQGCTPDLGTGNGIGGIALLNNSTLNKAFMGGSGGVGHANDGIGFFPPGNGGGIAFIVADKLKGNAHAIKANGGNATECPLGAGCTDGSSGGGGGGNIFLNVPTIINSCVIEVKGGKGANNSYNDPANYPGVRLGTGGGGGGGLVAIQQTVTAPALTVAVNGGLNGVNTAHSNDPHGATPGDNGIVINSFNQVWDNIPFKPNIDSVRIKDSFLTCNSFDFKGLAYTNRNPISNWQWNFGDGGTASTQNPTHTYATAGSFTVKLVITDINGCKDSITRNVLTSALTVNAGNDTTICSGGSVLLNASTNGGVQLQWNNASFLNNNAILNPLATPPTGTATTFIITATNSAGCSLSDTVNVIVKSQAVFAVNNSTSVCINDTIQLTASGGDTYLWTPALSLSDPNISNPIASPLVSTNYSVTITESTCNESTTLTVPVTVVPLPTIDATRSNDIDCTYDFSDLNAAGGATYIWSPAATLDNPSVRNPRARPTVTTQYFVKGTDVNGCSNYDSVIVKADFTGKGLFLLPNAFTPNNDGLNDCFGISLWGVLEEVEFNIYNRWGELIFHTTDATKCWDGKWKGREQNSGVFVYWVRAKSKCEATIFRKGTVLLIR